jgi:hypothetical protein
MSCHVHHQTSGLQQKNMQACTCNMCKWQCKFRHCFDKPPPYQASCVNVCQFVSTSYWTLVTFCVTGTICIFNISMFFRANQHKDPYEKWGNSDNPRDNLRGLGSRILFIRVTHQEANCKQQELTHVIAASTFYVLRRVWKFSKINNCANTLHKYAFSRTATSRLGAFTK